VCRPIASGSCLPTSSRHRSLIRDAAAAAAAAGGGALFGAALVTASCVRVHTCALIAPAQTTLALPASLCVCLPVSVSATCRQPGSACDDVTSSEQK